MPKFTSSNLFHQAWANEENIKSNLLQIVDAIVGPGFTNLASCKNHCIAKGQQLGTMIHYKNYNAIDSSVEEQICWGVHLVFSLEHPTIHQQCHFSPTFRDSLLKKKKPWGADSKNTSIWGEQAALKLRKGLRQTTNQTLPSLWVVREPGIYAPDTGSSTIAIHGDWVTCVTIVGNLKRNHHPCVWYFTESKCSSEKTKRFPFLWNKHSNDLNTYSDSEICFELWNELVSILWRAIGNNPQVSGMKPDIDNPLRRSTCAQQPKTLLAKKRFARFRFRLPGCLVRSNHVLNQAD